MESNKELRTAGHLLLEVGNLLMCSGANTARVRITINRIADALNYKVSLFITHRALMLTISDDEEEKFLSSLKRIAPHGANFKIISAISQLSYRIEQESMTIESIQQEVVRISRLPHYPRLLILFSVGLASAAFCKLFGGDYFEMLVAFVASFCGIYIRQQSARAHYNQYLTIFFASLVASFIAGSVAHFYPRVLLEHAFVASVLFLIPGVPLINTFSDMIDGNILNGILRGVHGLLVALAITMGMLITIIIYQF